MIINTIKWHSIPDNSQELKTYNSKITILKGKWIDGSDAYPIINMTRKLNFEGEKEIVWYLNTNKDNSGIGCFIKFDFYENQKFLLMQRKHWMQNTTFLITTIISALTLIVAYLALK